MLSRVHTRDVYAPRVVCVIGYDVWTVLEVMAISKESWSEKNTVTTVDKGVIVVIVRSKLLVSGEDEVGYSAGHYVNTNRIRRIRENIVKV